MEPGVLTVHDAAESAVASISYKTAADGKHYNITFTSNNLLTCMYNYIHIIKGQHFITYLFTFINKPCATMQ